MDLLVKCLFVRVEIVDQDGKSSLLTLVKAFDSVLAVYEGFCNLKQVLHSSFYKENYPLSFLFVCFFFCFNLKKAKGEGKILNILNSMFLILLACKDEMYIRKVAIIIYNFF